MKQEENNYNSIFKYTFIGAMLFVAAVAYTLAYFSNIVMFELSYTAITLLLSVSSVSLIYKAVKQDKTRLREVTPA